MLGRGNEVTELRSEYFHTLGIKVENDLNKEGEETETIIVEPGSRNGEAEKEKLKAALKRAYQLRNFEIEHYWKRATYFWGFQIAIFAAFGLLWKEIIGNKDATDEWRPVAVALAGLGILTAVANYLSARGSRFWQDNWEKHIDMLEDGIEGRLYKTVWLDKGTVSFSVSRVNRVLGYYFIVFWILVFLYVVWKYTEWSPLILQEYRGITVLALITMIVLGAGWLRCQRTNLEGTQPNRDNEAIERGSCLSGRIRRAPTKSAIFILRYAPDEAPPRHGRWRLRMIFVVTAGAVTAISRSAIG
jgi:hypothetical protein